MTITITLSTENAAFENHAGEEIARILKELAQQIGGWPGRSDFTLEIRDFNGNRVGKCVAE